MRTRSQSRENFPQQKASPAIVEPLRIENPFLEDQFQEDPPKDPPEVSMTDNRTMAEMLRAPYKTAIPFFMYSGFSIKFMYWEAWCERVYNRRTKKIMETMNVSFDELSAMAFEQRSLKPGLQSMTSDKSVQDSILLMLPATRTAPTTLAPQPEGFIDVDHPSHVYKLKKALYGLKQALKACLQVNLSPHGIFINHSNYVPEILKKYGMENCNPIGTPLETKNKLDLDKNMTPVNATKYRSMIGALMYLTSSRLEIVRATYLCARYQAQPTEKHLNEDVKIPLRVLQVELSSLAKSCLSPQELERLAK
nr:hypothetical protein [Tanacetum cinerariifolium]